MAEFSLANVLGGVSKLDTGVSDGREQIKYIAIDHMVDKLWLALIAR